MHHHTTSDHGSKIFKLESNQSFCFVKNYTVAYGVFTRHSSMITCFKDNNFFCLKFNKYSNPLMCFMALKSFNKK